MVETLERFQLPGFPKPVFSNGSAISWLKSCKFSEVSRSLSWKPFPCKTSTAKLSYSNGSSAFRGGQPPRKTEILAVPPAPTLSFELLDAWDDEYSGVIVDPESLPSSAKAFSSSLRASLSHWKLQGKRGIWLKIHLQQADLVPLAIQEGFNYHHAEPGYVMLTRWIPDEPCTLPAGPSHHIGIGGFVINDDREVLVVKEKCPCSCSGVWKLPTGYIDKSEDIFSGAMREVKEETGVDTIFLKMVAFRHAHHVAFEKSDLLFVCMLKPLSFKITIDEEEIQAAKWMPLQELLEQTTYEGDHLSRRVIEICIATYENRYRGFVAHQLSSKLDGKLSYLYYDDVVLFKSLSKYR
ncbi:hypothetical protein Nepgr_025620 [Nepenthes gracilis]|uniref:Nudix hydrolase domain-containing protein n=1 Tax=Nepenthes gracilis TaxID=150966 RepID=A0AAD3T858_NEPGR|nr:hypothetical protein Nepgr_025620 [Nepenthes gracilis]